MSNTTPDYIRRAVKRYEQKAVKLQVVLNMDKDDELQLYESIQDDDEPFSVLVKRLLKEHYKPN